MRPLLLAAWLGALAPAATVVRGQPAVATTTIAVGQSAETVTRGALLELTLPAATSLTAPFDPNEIAVDAHFVSPSGKTIGVPGFYFQDYDRVVTGETEQLTPKGTPVWKVRFAPTEEGRHTFTVTVKDRAGAQTSPEGAFVCEPAASHGYLRVSKSDPHYFEFDDGTPYLAIGHNVCWYKKGHGTTDYDRWFGRMAENEENYARLWMPEWAFGLETERLGEYRLDRAWQLDYVLRLAESKGIYVKLCLSAWRRFEAGKANPKSIDPWRHLTTTSLGSCDFDDALWHLPEMDWAQMHGYYFFNEAMKRDAKDMAYFIPHWQDKIRAFGKPAMFAEFGLSQHAKEWWPKDTGGVNLHTGIWPAIMSGGCGTAMLWWWDNQIDPMDQYWNFKPLAQFTRDVPWTKQGFMPDTPECSSGLKAFLLEGTDLRLLWIYNQAYTWWNVVNGAKIDPIKGGQLTLDRMGADKTRYVVEWWDTYKGGVIKTEEVQAAHGQVILTVPDLANDIAAKVRKRR